MWEKALPWIGGIFAGIGLIIIFYEVIMSIKQRNKTKSHIAGLVLLSVAVIGYVFTDIIFTDSAWPPLASLIWIAMFWAYVIMDACVTFGAVRQHRREAKAALLRIKKQEEQEALQEALNEESNCDETATTEDTPSDDSASDLDTTDTTLSDGSATDIDTSESTTDDQNASDGLSPDSKKKTHKRRK